jgi:predicted HAD superfamily Cof-like phosphohydrolase
MVDPVQAAIDAVGEFHVVFGLPINDPTRTFNELRAGLILEEVEEAVEAIRSGDLLHTAKELADLVYVAAGAGVTLGLNLNQAVHPTRPPRCLEERMEVLAGATALAAEALRQADRPRIARTLTRLIHVTFAVAQSLRIYLVRAVSVVHRSNISKLVDGKPVMRPDGKVLKGPNYVAPDMSVCVQQDGVALRSADQLCSG